MSRSDRVFTACASVTFLGSVLQGVSHAINHDAWWSMLCGFVVALMLAAIVAAFAVQNHD